jgi:hypothetical protein
LAGTKQRFSGLSEPRQCGDDVLRMGDELGSALLNGIRIAVLKTLGRSACARWRRHAPPHQGHLGASVGVADHRSRIVGEDAGHRREVADVAVDDTEERSDGSLVRLPIALPPPFSPYRLLIAELNQTRQGLLFQ